MECPNFSRVNSHVDRKSSIFVFFSTCKTNEVVTKEALDQHLLLVAWLPYPPPSFGFSTIETLHDDEK
jgi:hypothetical protein